LYHIRNRKNLFSPVILLLSMTDPFSPFTTTPCI
jgi:hypothetical protein